MSKLSRLSSLLKVARQIQARYDTEENMIIVESDYQSIKILITDENEELCELLFQLINNAP